MDKRFLEECLAEGMSLLQIGELVDKHPSTVGYWVKKCGLVANGAAKHSPRGGIVEEVLEYAVDEGMTVGRIASEMELSTSTVRHWLKKYGLSTGGRHPLRSKKLADPVGTRKRMYCEHHDLTDFVVEGSGYYRCVKCRSQAVMKRRRKMKEILVEEAGGSCVICGYAGSPSALEFHHLNPLEKVFQLSIRGRTVGIDKLRTEARKCVLLCATCHAEVEAGDAEVPLELAAVASDSK